MARKELVKAIAYFRTSSATNVGEDKDTLKRQRTAIEAFAKSAGYELIAEYRDDVILGLVAIFMAAPPFLQMLCGRPRLEFAADEFTGPDGKQLIIAVKNKKIESRFLRRLGVARETGNVLAHFDIQEQGTNRFTQKDVSALLHCAPTQERLILARALPGFTVGISLVHTNDQTTWVIDARSQDGNYQSISVGDYTARVTIVCGEQVHTVRRNFKVGAAPHLTFWV